jgi:hypothetical protein
LSHDGTLDPDQKPSIQAARRSITAAPKAMTATSRPAA